MSRSMILPRRIVDAHQHLWDESLPRPWLENVPSLRGPYTLEDYRREAAGLGIVGTVYVETDVADDAMEAEAAHVLALATQRSSSIAGIIAACRPERADFPDYLDRIRGDERVKGLRRVLHVVDDEVSTSATFRENIRRLAAGGLSFDICVLARQLPIAAALLDTCPDVQFVLDHCGNPAIDTQVQEPWRGDIAALAARPNIACKVSGLVTNADHRTWTTNHLRPYVETVIELFGWERVLFGSDWPVVKLAGTLRQWVEALSTITASASAEERDALFAANATRIYRLNVAHT